MARLSRIVLPGQAHHVALLGHNRQRIVDDLEDRRRFMDVLRDAALVHRVDVHAWALLEDRIHLMVTPREQASMGACLQAVARRHSAAYNKRHGRTGTLWADRYRASALQAGPMAAAVMLYIETLMPLPIEEVTATAAAVPMSSLAHHLGRLRDPLIVEPPFWWTLGNTPFEREAVWLARVEEGLPASQALRIQVATQRGWPLGDEGFLKDLAAQLGRPVQARPKGRPRRQPTE